MMSIGSSPRIAQPGEWCDPAACSDAGSCAYAACPMEPRARDYRPSGTGPSDVLFDMFERSPMLNIQSSEELTPVTERERIEPTAEDLARGALKFWSHEGITLPADDHGTIGAADLLEFAQLALKHYPDARIYPHAYGMRVTKSAGTEAPRLDWRDWD